MDARKDLYGLAFAAALSLAVCLIIFNNFVVPRGQMMWDEAEHAFTGLVFANDIQRLDFASLAVYFHQQILWPPLHPLFLSGFFIMFGPDITVGRASSLVLYFLFTISMYFLGREMMSKNRHVSGILCAVFSLATGSLYLSASEIMLEMLSLLFFSLSLLFFLRFLKDKRLWWTVPLFTLLTFFSKTNFGIVLIVSIAAYFLLKEKFHIVRLLRNMDFIRMLAPVLLIILLWVMPPDRLFIFLGFLVNRPEGPPPFSVEGLSFYPVQLFLYSGPLIFIYVAAAALSFKHLKNDKIRFLVIVALLAILLNFFHQNKKIRYILYLYPPLFALAAFHLTNLYARIKHKSKQIAFFVIVATCMIAFSFWLAGNTGPYIYDFSVAEPLAFIKNSTMDSHDVFLLGEFNELSPGLIAWDMSNISRIRQMKASSYYAWEFSPGMFEGLSIVNATADTQGMSRFLDRHGFDAIVLVDVKNSSRFYSTYDYLTYNKWKFDYIPIVMENGNYTIQDYRLFQDIGVEITVLKKV
jgi:4-amino-4-deoxy-L-arabinose transferase-like glycosyltransferase